jgi:hypothetical protein
MKLNAAWEALKRNVLGATTAGNTSLSVPDEFPLNAASPHYNAHRLINDFYAALPEPKLARLVKPAQHPTARLLLEGPQPEQFLALEAMLSRRAWLERAFQQKGCMDARVCEFRDILQNLGLLLCRRAPCATPDQAAGLVSIVASIIRETGTRNFEKDIPALLKICESLGAQGQFSENLSQALQQLKAALSRTDDWEGTDRRRAKDTIDRILAAASLPSATGRPPTRSRKPPIVDRRDSWAQPMFDFLTGLADAQAFAWDDLMAFALTATSSKPSGKWLKEAGRLLEAVGRDPFKQQVGDWFAAVRPTEKPSRVLGVPEPPLSEENAELLKGLVWCCALFEDAGTVQAVSHLAQACFKKVPNFGPLSAKVGNACLYTLSALPGFEPVAQLSRLRLKVKYAVALRLIDRALQEAAEKLGMTTDELEEIAVPTYGLDESGNLREEFGEFTAEVKVVGTAATELRWFKQDGKEQKTVPAQVKEAFAEDWKELKRTIQEIENMLPAQRDRLERLLVQEREWEYEKWLQRYHNHPLLSGLSRRLIWQFRQENQSVLAAWHEGRFIDVEDRPVEGFSAATRVRLWHPLGSEVSTVAAWRGWLERHQVTQPFKQAHREIYILTDAELQTGTYSNRFAAHIIRQHQFAALARQRDWKYTLQGAFDSHNTPSLLLPRLDLVAEFWVDSATGNEATSDMGIFLYLATDQVRFRDHTNTARPLVDIPALVFSEVMRDVDLFVGVCSVGNDPEWQDRGEAGTTLTYWREASFGALSATAKTRREVLERLLPRLKIASKCQLQERFLRVQGALRAYKIHLGSGNILMEPNDSYLCIVPGQSSASSRSLQDIFLPFEGDNTLAVILSKAFLLAEDTKIKDETILRQITPR